MTPRLKPEERRREIADAVLKIVAERGLGRLTAAEIAREVGVSDAALFHHFRGMEEIVLAAIDRVEELLFEKRPPDGADPLERLRWFFRERVATIARHPGAGRLILSEVLTQVAPPSGVARVKAFRRRSFEFVRSCLHAAHAAGELAAGLDVANATVLVFGSLMALTQARDLVAPDGSPDVLAGTVWRDLEQTLRRRPLRSTGERQLRRKAK
jgi:AcrR family transcriptional regulator